MRCSERMMSHQTRLFPGYSKRCREVWTTSLKWLSIRMSSSTKECFGKADRSRPETHDSVLAIGLQERASVLPRKRRLHRLRESEGGLGLVRRSCWGVERLLDRTEAVARGGCAGSPRSGEWHRWRPSDSRSFRCGCLTSRCNRRRNASQLIDQNVRRTEHR